MNLIDHETLRSVSPWNAAKALEQSDPVIQKQLTFNTKEEYLAWRAEWKQLYADLSQEIRDTRKEWRAQGSDHDFPTQNRLFSARALARSMLTLRHASRVRAQDLYLAAKEAAQVA